MRIEKQAAFWIAAFLAFLLFVWLFSDILLPFIMGMALAYLLDPVADRLERAGMSRLWATVTIVFGAILLIVLALLLLVPVLASQLTGFLERLPSYVARLQELGVNLLNSEVAKYVGVADARGTVESVVSQGASWVVTILGSVWAGGQALISVLSLLVVTPVVAFYILYDWDRMVAYLDRLLPRDHVGTIRGLGRQIDHALAGFIRGQGSVCVILGAFYAVALTLTGLNFGFLIGSVAGLISFIPYVGSIVGFVLAISVALVQFWPDWIWVAVVAGIFAVGQFVEGNILQPRLVGHSVGVHPVWLMFALFAFGSLFGFVGLLLAVPATAAIGVLIRFALAQYQGSRIYWGQSHRIVPPEDPAG